jgi:hypothetical protein
VADAEQRNVRFAHDLEFPVVLKHGHVRVIGVLTAADN